jgi:Tol biopolymer transport system component
MAGASTSSPGEASPVRSRGHWSGAREGRRLRAGIQRLLRIVGVFRVAAAAVPLAMACAPQLASKTLLSPTGDAGVLVAFDANEGTQLAFDASPDGATIVFDLLGQLWTLPASGGIARAITNAVLEHAEDLDPAFSPDGSWIAFQADRPDGRALWLIPAAGGTPRRLTETTLSYAWRADHAWSPDARRLAYISRDTVRVVDVASGEDLPISIDSLPNSPIRSVTWSADGSRLVFVNGYSSGSLWAVPAGGGAAQRIELEHPAVRGPAYSRSGTLAYFAPDSAGRQQLWVVRPGGGALKLTDQDDVVTRRVRWLAGDSLLYSAGGKLWRMGAAGGLPAEVPFTARVEFVRRAATDLGSVTFAGPGVTRAAVGFSGLALAPDALRIAMLALDSLWVWEIGKSPVALAATGPAAKTVAWSPDGSSIVFSAGRRGAEALFVTDTRTGNTGALTALPGRSREPRWSPDGQWIAFLHADSTASWKSGYRLRVVSPARGVVSATSETHDLGEASWYYFGQEPIWSPESDALLVYAGGFDDRARAELVPLEGARQPVGRFPAAPTFSHWSADGSLTFVQDAGLWRSSFNPSTGLLGEAEPLSGDPALYPSVASDGTVLYVSTDGLRLRRPTGAIERIGWPLSFRTPDPAAAVVVRNVRIHDGTGAPASAPQDLVLADGRISAILPAGQHPVEATIREIDGRGTWAIPGLIDLHVHVPDAFELTGQLAFGVTTVRDAGTPIAVGAAIRDAVDAGLLSAPRLVLGGFQYGGGHGLSGEIEQMLSDSSAISRSLFIAEAFGAQYVKHRPLSGWFRSAQVIKEAHRRGLRVSGHCTHPLPLAAAGIDGREHNNAQCFRDGPVLFSDMLLLTRAAGLWVVPTVGFFTPYLVADTSYLQRPDVAPFITPYLADSYQEPPEGAARASYERFNRISRQNTAALRALGVRIGAGTDSELPHRLHWELEGLVRSGLTPLEAIRAATLDAAIILGAERDIGSIHVGKRADIVILDADPGIEIGNTQRIRYVIKDGRVVERYR